MGSTPPSALSASSGKGLLLPSASYEHAASHMQTVQVCACMVCRYAVGQMQTDDPEEERKQKEMKGFLNKITPEKFDTIRNKIVSVGIDKAITLQGLIDQVPSPSTCLSVLHASLNLCPCGPGRCPLPL